MLGPDTLEVDIHSEERDASFFTMPTGTTLSEDSGNIKVSVPDVVPPGAPSGVHAYVHVSNDGGVTWHRVGTSFGWGTASDIPTSIAWNSDAKLNQAIAKTDVYGLSLRLHIKR